jgi:hypothetical protein
MTTDPDQIREQIEDTRTSLSEDVNALADTVNPAHAAKRTAASARSAVLDVKDKVMGAASQSAANTTSAAKDQAWAVQEKVAATPDRLRRQATGNPLAVGLIAVGVGWLVGSLLPASSAEQRAAAKAEDAVAPAVTDAARDAAASLQDSAKSAVESVKAVAAEATAAVKNDSASSAGDIRVQTQAASDRQPPVTTTAATRGLDHPDNCSAGLWTAARQPVREIIAHGSITKQPSPR